MFVPEEFAMTTGKSHGPAGLAEPEVPTRRGQFGSWRCLLRSDRPTHPGSNFAARYALYVCHHQLVNSYLLRCTSCPHHELGGDTLSMARLRGQDR